MGGKIVDPCPPQERNFFSREAFFKGMAADLKMSPDLLMALSAQETTWGRASSFRVKNNPFGVSFKEKPYTYPSLEAAKKDWINMFGADVQGATTIDQFVQDLQTVGKYQKLYNSANPKYFDTLRSVHQRVLRFAKICGVSL